MADIVNMRNLKVLDAVWVACWTGMTVLGTKGKDDEGRLTLKNPLILVKVKSAVSGEMQQDLIPPFGTPATFPIYEKPLSVYQVEDQEIIRGYYMVVERVKEMQAEVLPS